MKARVVLGSILAGVITTGGGVMSTASPASAAWICQDHTVCLFHDADLRGTVSVLPELSPNSGHYTGLVPEFGTKKYTNGENLNNSASSLKNRTGKYLYLFKYNDFNSGHQDGWNVCIPPGTQINLDGWANDDASSAILETQSGCYQ